jgi:5-methylcytosine-specific restriction protein A
MGKITNEMIHESYDLGKLYYEDKISRKEGIQRLVEIDTNPASASFLLSMYKWHVVVTEYKKLMNSYGIEYYLKRLHEERGVQGLSIALQSLKLNLKYSESPRNGMRKAGWEIYHKYTEITQKERNTVFYPDEKGVEYVLLEGKQVKILVNKFERNREARSLYIQHYGVSCQVCDFDFEESFGEIGKDFIHVHHLFELSTIAKEYEVDPISDLIPVCPNCHAMLHKRKPAYTVLELRHIIDERI